VEDLRVRESGQRVTRGQILGTIYSPDLISAQQVFLSTRLLADRAQAQPTAAGPAFQTDPLKRLDFLGVAQQDIDRLARSRKVENTLPFRSPVTGYVARKIEAPGAYVQPGTELFRIADLSTVWLTAEVTERDAKRVRVGQRVTFFPAVGSGETYAGTVELVYPALDPESRMQSIRVLLPNEALELRPGMSGDVVIAVDSAEGLTVPRDALVETGELQYVFVSKDGGRFEPRVVHVGTRGHDHVVLLDGVAEGERVVTTANFMIDAESRVRAAVQAYSR
jgi:Cu(I)/Ag(I) efflux system membrane fusion protein